MKKIFLAPLCFSLAFLFSIPSFAVTGSWRQGPDDTRFYLYEDGTYPHGGWALIDDVYYYFDEEGYLLRDAWTPDGYYVGSDGAWDSQIAQKTEAPSAAEDGASAAEVLKGLVSDDILAAYRRSGAAKNAVKAADGTYDIEKTAFALGEWVESMIPELPASVAKRAETVNNRYEWCFGTDISNSTKANFPYYYGYYYALKDYYNSRGRNSRDTHQKLLENGSIFMDKSEVPVSALYEDLKWLITDFNNLIRSMN